MSAQPGALRILSNTQDPDRDPDVDILLIAGISTPAADSWAVASPDWLSTVLPEGFTKARILVFDYVVSLTEADFTCQDFLLQGDVLLSALSDARSQFDTRPLLCICHSVGGLVLKQALCIANEQVYLYGSILNSVAGIIFLGTLHSGSTDAESLSRLLTILAKTTGTKKRINIGEQNLSQQRAMLGQLGTRFEAISLRSPVLTVWESQKTRVSEGLLKSKMVFLTDKRLCAVHSPLERFLALPLDHAALCKVELMDQNCQRQIGRFIAESLADSVDVIAERLKALEFKYATTSNYSPIDSENLTAPPAKLPPNSTLMGIAGTTEPEFELISHPYEITPKRPKPKLPCIHLPTHDRGRIFFRRQDILDAMRDALLPVAKAYRDGPDLKQFALCGLGGIGKTEIALEFALRFKDSFDAIFWVQADETAKLDRCFQDMSVKLGLETAAEAQSQVVSRSVLKGWLANPTKGDLVTDADVNPATSLNKDASWLIIFDNADDPTLLGDYWPDGPGSVLVTSRDPLAKTLFSTRSLGVDLGPLSDEDGGALLLQLTGSDDSPEEEAESIARSISHGFAGLPLALTQMAGIIRRNDLSLSEFLSLYQEEEERTALYSSKFNTGATVYQHSIATVWAFEKLSEEAKVLLRAASFLDPDMMQESILFDAVSALIADNSFSKSQFSAARTELLQTSLFKRDKGKNELSEYRVSVHRLVQDAVLATMAGTDADATIAVLVNILWQIWPPTLGPPTKPIPFLQKNAKLQHYQVSRYPQCASLYPHIIALKQRWKLTTSCTVQTKTQFAALMTDGALYQNERGRTRDFDGFLAMAEELLEDTEGDARDAVLVDLHYSQGLILAGNNNIAQAERHQKAFFALQRGICDSIGPDYIDEKLCLAYCELGSSHLLVGRLDESIKAQEQERDIRKRLGPGSMLNNIPLARVASAASAYMMRGLPGDLDRAEEVLLEQIEIAERTGTVKSSHVTGRLIYTLGNLRALQGKEDEAYSLHFRAHQLLVETRSEREIPRSKHKLAEHFMKFHRYEEAIKLINDALQRLSYDAEVYRPELARTTFLKAQLLEKMGKVQKANVAYRVVGRLRAEVVPNDKRDVKSLTMKDFDDIVTYWTR